MPLDKLPKAVVEAVKKRFPKAEMIGAAKETEDGKTEYEVTIKDGGKTRNGSIRACPTGLGIATTSRLMMSPIHVRCADLTTWN